MKKKKKKREQRRRRWEQQLKTPRKEGQTQKAEIPRKRTKKKQPRARERKLRRLWRRRGGAGAAGVAARRAGTNPSGSLFCFVLLYSSELLFPTLFLSFFPARKQRKNTDASQTNTDQRQTSICIAMGPRQARKRRIRSAFLEKKRAKACAATPRWRGALRSSRLLFSASVPLSLSLPLCRSIIRLTVSLQEGAGRNRGRRKAGAKGKGKEAVERLAEKVVERVFLDFRSPQNQKTTREPLASSPRSTFFSSVTLCHL